MVGKKLRIGNGYSLTEQKDYSCQCARTIFDWLERNRTFIRLGKSSLRCWVGKNQHHSLTTFTSVALKENEKPAKILLTITQQENWDVYVPSQGIDERLRLFWALIQYEEQTDLLTKSRATDHPQELRNFIKQLILFLILRKRIQYITEDRCDDAHIALRSGSKMCPKNSISLARWIRVDHSLSSQMLRCLRWTKCLRTKTLRTMVYNGIRSEQVKYETSTLEKSVLKCGTRQ